MLGFSSRANWRNCCTARCWSIWYRLFIATLSFFLGRKNHPRPIMTADVRVATFYELTGILRNPSSPESGESATATLQLHKARVGRLAVTSERLQYGVLEPSTLGV